MNILYLIIPSAILLAGFIVLYFFILPRLLVKGLVKSVQLEAPRYSGWLYMDEYLYTASGKKNQHTVEFSFRQHFIFPEFEIQIGYADEKKYNFYFMETYFTNFKKYADKKYLYQQLLQIFNYENDMRRSICRLSNEKLRKIIINFLSRKLIVDIYGKHINLKYKIWVSYLILFFRKKMLQQALEDTFWLSGILALVKDEDLLVENINREENIDLKILNFMMLFNEEKHHTQSINLFQQYEHDDNRTIAIIARCGLEKAGYEDIAYLVKNDNAREKNFALENMSRFPLEKNEKIDLLVDTLDTSVEYSFYTRAFNSLIKIARDQAEEILLTFLKKSKKHNEFSYLDNIYFVRFIGEQAYTKCYDFVISHLGEGEESIVKEAIDTLVKLKIVKAVEHLLPLARGMQSLDIKTKAREAITALQQDIPVTQRGSLSISENTAAGQLSISDEEEGKLSPEEENKNCK